MACAGRNSHPRPRLAGVWGARTALLAALAGLVTAGCGGGGTSAPAPLTGNTAIQAAVVSGFQAFHGGLSYPLRQVQATLPGGSRIGQARASAVALPPTRALALGRDDVLGLYESGFTIGGNVLTDSFYLDLAGTTPAGALTVTYPAGTTISALGETSATPPYTMSIAANVTAGSLPMRGSGTIVLADAAGAGELQGTFTLPATGVTIGADLRLSDGGAVTGTATITENGQTISITDISGPFDGTLTGVVAVAPQGFTGTARVSILLASFEVTLDTPAGPATGTFGTGGLTITFPDGSQETLVSPLTTQPAAPPASATGLSISGTVYRDANLSGALDAGEAGIEGVTVTLSGPGATATATTTADGTYRFARLAVGTYTVSAPAAAGGASLGTAGSRTVMLSAGRSATGVDFGYRTNTNVRYGAPVKAGANIGLASLTNDGEVIWLGTSYMTSSMAAPITLEKYQGYTASPLATNGGGEIIGFQTNYAQSVVWATPTSVPTAIPDGFPLALNDGGELVGSLQYQGPGGYWASASAPGAALKVPASTRAHPLAINAAGFIAGLLYDYGTDLYKVATWAGPLADPVALAGDPVPLRFAPGPQTTYLELIRVNAAGQVLAATAVGTAVLPLNRLWASSTAQPVILPYLPGALEPQVVSFRFGALAMSGAGDVVGCSTDSTGAPRAVIWQGGAVQDLNSLIPSGSGWILDCATGINDSGAIVGIGRLNGGGYLTFRLTPN